VQLGGQVERDPVGPLGFHHHLILAEDGVLELLQHLVGLVQVVVPADQHVAHALLGADRLGCEEVHHAALAAPAQPEHDRVRQVQFVPAGPLGRAGLLVAEHREVVAVRRLGPGDRVVQHMLVGAYLVPRHHRPVRVAEQPRVHPREVP
jgi:hypothetical protein